MKLKFSVLIIFIIGSSLWVRFASASDFEPADILLKEVQLPSDITIETVIQDNRQVNIVKFASGDSITLPLEPSSEEERSYFNSLSAEDKKKMNDDRKEMLLAFIRTVQSRNSSPATLVQDTVAHKVVVAESALQELGLKQADPVADVLQVPDPKATDVFRVTSAKGKVSDRFKRIVHFVNEAVIVSSIHSYRAHRDNLKSVKYADIREFGLSFAIKGELQFGIGKYNLLKSLPLFLSIGFNRDFKAVMIRVGLRREQMAAGTAISAGVKLELRNYRLTAVSEAQRVSVEGVSWYPPSIPVASIVADSGRGYASEGIVVGLNAADLIPGAAFTNTVNSFIEYQRVYRFQVLPVGSIRWLRDQFSSLVRQRRKPALVTCQAIFAPI